MSRACVALVLHVVSWVSVAQSPPPALRVEVVGDTHRTWHPIVVRVINLTDNGITFAFPVYADGELYARGTSTLRSWLPIELERKSNTGWVPALPAESRRVNSVPSDVKPNALVEFTFGVVGSGEYRVRVWYVIAPPLLGPPRKPAARASVLSKPFSVNSK